MILTLVANYLVYWRHDLGVLSAQAIGYGDGEGLMIGVLFESALGGHAVLLVVQRLGHVLHARVGVAVRRAAVHVVAVLRVRHDEHADVGHRAEVNKLADLVLQAAHVQERVHHVLEYACDDEIMK